MRFAVCTIVWLLVLGCDPEFPDRSLVEGYRVLGVVAVPLMWGRKIHSPLSD